MNTNIVDVNTLAQFWNVDPRTIQNYADISKYNPPLPREERGKYDFIKAMKWMYEMQKDKIYKLENSGDEGLSDLKKEKQIMDNKKAELELKKMLFQLVDKKTVLIAWTNQLNVLKNNDTQLQFELKRDLEGVIDETEKSKIVDELFHKKDEQLEKIEIAKYIISEELLVDEEI